MPKLVGRHPLLEVLKPVEDNRDGCLISRGLLHHQETFPIWSHVVSGKRPNTAVEIRALKQAELEKQLEAAHQELFELRFQAATKQLVNHREIPRLKRKIARIKTVLREQELAQSGSAE